jgi:hypothetical protein
MFTPIEIFESLHKHADVFLHNRVPMHLELKRAKRPSSFCLGYFVTKKRGSEKHIAHWLPSTNPNVHVLLIYFTHTDLQSSRHSNCLLTLSYAHYRSKTYKHSNIADLTAFHLMPRPFTQMSTKETLTLHYRLCTFPESTSFLSIRCSQNSKLPNTV